MSQPTIGSGGVVFSGCMSIC